MKFSKTKLAEDLFVKILGDDVPGQDWGWAARLAFDVADAFAAVEQKRGDTLAASIPENAACFFMDGDKWCCVHGDFKNLQESPAGFGETFEAALEALRKERRVTTV